MKYYIIAGEASGDLHAANLMKALLAKDPQANFRFWGGDRMQAVGGTLVKHYKDLAFMGFLEVLLNLRTILKNISFCKKDISEFKPDILIFVDYPGFNMRIAKWAKQQGIPTHYYISPQIWAWKENRIKAIKRDVDAMYVILPFEKDFYEKKHQYRVHFVSGKTYDLLSISYAALVTSGTATLETALLNIPEVVCYKGNWISYHIAKRIIKLKYISLVNLIMDKPVVTELIQGDLTKKNLKIELDKLSTYRHRYEVFKDYVQLREKLGGEGASEKVASLILKQQQ